MFKKVTFISAIIVGLLFTSSCTAQSCPAPATVVSTPTPTVPQLTVSGTGLVYVVPDIAYIYVGVHSQAETVAKTLTQNNQLANAIRDALVAQGVAVKDIQTSSFNIYPQPEYDNNGKVTRNLFAVDNSVYVTVRNLENLSALLDVVANTGANSINGVYFDVQDKSSALEQARQLAIADAKKQAEQVAAVAGVTLGRLLNINLYNANAPVIAEGKGGGGGAPMASSQVPVSTGQMSITADVTLVYELK
jgi:uncharacterized protein YggE